MRGVVFDGAIPRYLATKAAGAVSSRLMTGPRRCTNLLDDVDVPTLPGPRWVRLRTRLGGICGSDLNLVNLNVSPSMSPFSTFPFVVGHENVGVVEEVGAEVARVSVGSRVVVNPLLPCAVRGIHPPCRHCMEGKPSRCENFLEGDIPAGMLLGTCKGLGGSWGEHFVAHESQLYEVPQGMSDKAAVLLEPLATVLSPIMAGPPAADAKILVIGGGSIGLLAVAALKAISPHCDVTLLARYDFQAQVGEELGADRIVRGKRGYFAELSRLTDGKLVKPILGKKIHIGGFDGTVVCVGSDGAVDDALRFTRAGGSILLLGNVSTLKKVDWTPLWQKELSLRGSLCYNLHSHEGAPRHAFDLGLEILGSRKGTQLESLVTHTFPLEAYQDALRIAGSKSKEKCIKVAFQFDN